MFERYTEMARRTIFFARYEASQYGCSQIEAEHLLLGVLREDKALANRFLQSYSAIEFIRRQIEERTPISVRAQVSTSVDLPLSHECKRVLAYGAEEAERLAHKHLGTEHLLLGLLREEKCFAAQLLLERGISLEFAREQLQQSSVTTVQGRSVSIAGFLQWIADRKAEGKWAIEHRVAANSRTGTTTDFAFYAAEAKEDHDPGPSEKLAQAQNRIDFAVKQLERAIANHEFEKARFYSEEERTQREHLRRLSEEFNLEAPPPRVPLLCIAVIAEDHFSELRQRSEGYIAEGAAEVWLLDLGLKRAYTVTKADGLREFKGEMLKIVSPPLVMDLSSIFSSRLIT